MGLGQCHCEHGVCAWYGAPEAALPSGCLGVARTEVARWLATGSDEAGALGFGGAGNRKLRCLGRNPLARALQSGIISVGEGLVMRLDRLQFWR